MSSSPEMVKKFEDMVSGKRLYALKKEEKDLNSSTRRVAVQLVDTTGLFDVVINRAFTQ